jgi:hypothetical protein
MDIQGCLGLLFPIGSTTQMRGRVSLSASYTGICHKLSLEDILSRDSAIHLLLQRLGEKETDRRDLSKRFPIQRLLD